MTRNFSQILSFELENLNDYYLENDSNLNCKYYSSERFNNEFITTKNSDLSIIHCNIRSLNANGEEFISFLHTLKLNFDVICFSETWCKDEDLLNSFFPNYKGFHSYRPENKRGGGVSIYVRKRFHTKLLNQINENNEIIECLFLQLSVNRKLTQIGCVYRPPHGNHSSFNSSFECKLHSLNGMTGKLVIVGDFNYDLMKVSTDARCSDFFDCISTCSLMPAITKPTHFTSSVFSLIDNIFVSGSDGYSSGVLTFDVSDHLPIFIIYKNIFQRDNSIPERISYRIDKAENLENCFIEFSKLDLSYLYELDTNCALRELSRTIFEVYDRTCPIKTKHLSFKDHEKPWIDHRIKIFMKKRQNMFNLYKLNRISTYSYNRYRNFVTSEIRKAKKTFFENKFKNFKRDIKQTWSIINSILKPHKTKTEPIIKPFFHNNVFLDEDSEIATIFNDHFSTVGSRISESISVQSENDPLSFMSSVNISNSFFLRPVSVFDVSLIINSLKNKSCPMNTFPAKVIKIINPLVSPILTKILNDSINKAEFPEFMKTARVLPVFKGGDSNNVSNFRPISILPIFSKIFERLVYNQLYSYIEKFNLLDQNQFGFRTKRSTSQAILDYMQDIYEGIDKGDFVISIFLDFSKAFYCIII